MRVNAAAPHALVAVALAAGLLCATPASALPVLPEQPPASIPVTIAGDSATATGTVPAVESTTTSADDALHQALSLEQRIASDTEDAAALEHRIDVANMRLFRQQDVLSKTESTLSDAQTRYSGRLIDIYKGGALDPLLVLLSSHSLDEFSSRLGLFMAVVRQDRATLTSARIAAEQAAYEQTRLEDLKAQLVMMRSLKARRLEDMKAALAVQKRIARTLTSAQARLVSARHDERQMSFREWRKTTIPVGTPITYVPASVTPHADTFLVAEYQPKKYQVVSAQYQAVCSWYGDEFNGLGTASGQLFNEDDFTCASRTLPFGTRLALERAGKRIVVVVTDRGPFIAGRDLDLSKKAAFALGFDGVEPVTAEFVEIVR